MRLEHLPVFLGALFGLIGLLLVIDAVVADGTFVSAERRQRQRAERHRGGEIALGIGALLVGAALIGRDSWRYGTVAVLVAVVLFGLGLFFNWPYVSGLTFGPLEARRRRDEGEKTPTPPEGSGRYRLR